MRRYYAPTLKTLDMGWVPENSRDDYGRYKVVLARDFDALLACAKRLYEELVPFATYEEGARLVEDFRERWLQEDIDGE